LLDRALKHPARTLAISAAIVACSLALIPVVGFSLFPKAETPQFHVDITAPEGASIAATDSAARFAERVLAQWPQGRTTYTSVGHDNPRVYYNVASRPDNQRVGQLFVLLDRYDQRHTPALLDSLRSKFSTYPGAEIAVREFTNGPQIDAPIALRVEGESIDSLGLIAARVATILAETPGTQSVGNPA